FCPYAALAYGPEEAPTALSVQPHPEYRADILQALAADRLGKVVPTDRMQPGLESLSERVDATPWVLTITEFFRAAGARKVAA
ncbi:MAG: hypothetical protein AAGF22_12815, partial [Pseudomonadota bacterium]